MALHIVGQSLGHHQAGSVLLGGKHQAGLGQLGKSLVDGQDILTFKVVMIAKGERGNLRLILLQIVHQLLGRGYACKEQYILILKRLQTIVGSHIGLICKHGAGRIVL